MYSIRPRIAINLLELVSYMFEGGAQSIHIHKPQKVNAGIPVYYSGSPFPLSFSERKDEKRVLLIDTDKSFEPESISLPNFRQLIRLSGNLEELQLKLNSLENHSKLTSLIEVDLEEDQYDAQKIYALDKMVNEFDPEGFEIVKQSAQFRNRVQAASEFVRSWAKRTAIDMCLLTFFPFSTSL